MKPSKARKKGNGGQIEAKNKPEPSEVETEVVSSRVEALVPEDDWGEVPQIEWDVPEAIWPDFPEVDWGEIPEAEWEMPENDWPPIPEGDWEVPEWGENAD